MAVMLTCSDVAGPSISGSGDLSVLSDRFLLFPPLLILPAATLDLSVTTTTILLSGRVTSSCIRSIDDGAQTKNTHILMRTPSPTDANFLFFC